MEGMQINNPVVLEERKLDLEVRMKYLDSQMKDVEQLSQKKQINYNKILAELKVEEDKYNKRQRVK